MVRVSSGREKFSFSHRSRYKRQGEKHLMFAVESRVGDVRRLELPGSSNICDSSEWSRGGRFGAPICYTAEEITRRSSANCQNAAGEQRIAKPVHSLSFFRSQESRNVPSGRIRVSLVVGRVCILPFREYVCILRNFQLEPEYIYMYICMYECILGFLLGD